MRALVLGLLLVTRSVAAQEIAITGPLRGEGFEPSFAPRQTANPVRRWSIGVFDPLRIGVGEDLELATHPLLFLALDPNAELKVRHSPRGKSWAVATTWGLSVPTVPMRLTQGYLFPSWEQGGGRIGWFVVPSVGLLVTWGRERAWTLGLETSIGLQIGENEARPLDGYAPLEVAFGAALGGTRTHAHANYDVLIFPGLRARLGLEGWFLGRRTPEPEKSPWILAARGGLDIRLSRRTRLALGLLVFDYDDHRTEVRKDEAGKWRRVPVRSVDVYPTFDLVYEH